ncbi:hypothetical protein AA23498_2138 [Acetobacter nitrogenifigens DSM 23921 = NBRC 105050]|uniref:DUF4440 domain-containing protein n=1 Tax=Acetobacter nitrogenifigens DSM 23921 = NBRC 105050 TaxID=1120919 RepID=A0A511XFG7_9PROT|nr:hypothetical protein [Acetobacter nitrogenifigens]GBQ94894.1 hypothetical protein AA23498_2138 [Acetobacter nitrogenifigens DSM 23921 = NBRC 105050]GEN61641.1 hypothetical protein ANI02nite_35250 [Acetobacter nitrogenifigens DSM 23921 = NBRC 105050]
MNKEELLNKLETEVVDLHVVLQAWFRGEGGNDPSVVTRHFDADFQMVGAAGRVLSCAVFAAALPGLYGSRPGLVMEIQNVEIRHVFNGGVVGFYREIQTQGEQRTERWSSVVLVDGEEGFVWKQLHETFCS